jgi:alpha-amylase
LVAVVKKQTGSDGWRWDAVKHFAISTQETSIWHSKYNATLTAMQAGGQEMFCVGEWIGDQGSLDAYANSVASSTAPGGVTNEKHTGTFDFGLRGYNTSNNGGLFQLVRSNGSFNMVIYQVSNKGLGILIIPVVYVFIVV